MKVLVLYFSGTGNTEYIARYIRDHFNKEKYEVELVPIERLNKKEVQDYDILGFGFPVYAFDMPNFMKDHLNDLPLVKTKSLFIFSTKGFYSGTAIKRTMNYFENLGYIPIAYADIAMPGSDGLAFMSPDSKRAQKYISRDFSKIAEADEMIKEVESIFSHHTEGVMDNKRIKSNVKISEAVVNKVLNTGFTVVEGMLKKKFRADESCIKCMKCEKICPLENIKVDDNGVHFGEKCVVCMRCLHQCPKESIQIGKKTVGKVRWKGPLGDYNPQKRV